MSTGKNILNTIDVTRLILTHWIEGIAVDQIHLMHSIRLTRAQLVVDFKTMSLAEEAVPECWDVALSLAKFAAFSLGLKIPDSQKGLRKCS